jgi:outer membrane protein TolC
MHGVVSTASASQDAPMTIDEAIAIAERNAFAVRIQNAALEKDRQAVALALSALGPTAGFTTTLTQYGQEVDASFGPGTSPVVVSPFRSGSEAFAINLPIDIAGNLNRLVAANKKTYEAARRTLEASFNDARLNARSAYILVLRDKALVVVSEEAVKDAKDRLTQSQQEFEQKQVAKVDVDRLDAQVAQATSDLLNAQNNLALAKQSFNQTLARPIENRVDLADLPDAPPVPTDLDALTKVAQVERPEARALVDQIQALAYIRRAQESGMDPSLALSLGYTRNLATTALAGNPNSISAGILFTVPVFDSGATRARVREARQDENTAKVQLQQEQLQISSDVRSAVTNFLSAKARQANAQRQLTLAEEVYRLAQVRQQAGEGTYIDVVDAESSLEQARNGVVSAKYDLLLAYSQLQHGVGNDKVDEPAKSQPNPAPSTISSVGEK